MNKRFVLIIFVLLALGLLGFHRFGRSVWHPLKVRVAGGRTVQGVLDDLCPKMEAEFPHLAVLCDGRPIALLAFKEERRLEFWKQRETGWAHVRSYPLTAFSGELGPKLAEGDGQIPEGVYEVEGLNPNSAYHLSIKISYPNPFDRARAEEDGRTKLGGDIFVHGRAVTIGCIPIGDDAIEEVFYLIAANGWQGTRVIIAPFDMRREPDRPLARISHQVQS